MGSFLEPIDIQILTEDAVFTSPNIGRLQWLSGVYGSATWEKTDLLVLSGGAGPSAQALYSERRVDERQAAAIYGEASYLLTDRLTATAGLRAAASSAQTTSNVQAPQQGQQRLYSGRTVNSGITPKLALTYQLAPNETLYALASEGGRSAGINTAGPIGTVFVSGDSPANTALSAATNCGILSRRQAVAVRRTPEAERRPVL